MMYARAPDEKQGFDDFLDKLERDSTVSVEYNSHSRTITLESEDPLAERQAADAIRAYELGISPEKALTVLKDNIFHAIELSRFVNNDNELDRQKARIIGRNGKTIDLIRELTGASVSIDGSVVACVGSPNQTRKIRHAVSMFANGSPHSTVYGFLERGWNDAVIQVEQ